MTTHVIGAGLAGLSAAMCLVEAGQRVVLYEAGPAAGGRCRSYFDRALGCRIDNGNHLLLSGNDAAWAFMDRVGSRGTMGGPGRPVFPFVDLASGERWVVRPNAGRVPWWVLSRGRRVPGMRLGELGGLLALRRAGEAATVAEVLGGEGALWARLLEPLAVSALNTRPEEASARLLAAVMEGSLGRGGRACVPSFPREGLSETFVDPAVAWLAARGAVVRLGTRVSGLRMAGGRVAGLALPGSAVPGGAASGGEVALGAGDAVVLAVPPLVVAGLLPGLDVPDAFEAIVNLHYRVDALPGETGFVGLVGGLAEWVFVKRGVVSVTISAANRLLDRSSEDLAEAVWAEVRAALSGAGDGAFPAAEGLGAMPAWRVVREKRATFAATPAQERQRPRADAAMRSGMAANLALAGDWTATGLPATIEGAIRSGCTAADAFARPGLEAA